MKNRIVLWIAGAIWLASTSALSQTAGISAGSDDLRLLSANVASPSMLRSGAPSQPPDSAEALRRCLQNALAVARSGDNQKLAFLVQEMEIPNYRAWFIETYGPAGRTLAEAYGAKLDAQDLARVHMLQATARWMKLARTKTVLIRRINDAPSPGDPFENNAVTNLQRPVSIYFAYHNASGAPNHNPIGYFVFVDGKFRWQSGFVEDVVTHRIIVDGVR